VNEKGIKDAVKKTYSEIASQETESCCSSCG